jgi:hypothetical protein
MADRNCPICGSNKCQIHIGDDGIEYVQCRTFDVNVGLDVTILQAETETQARLTELAAEKLLAEQGRRRNGDKKPWVFGMGPDRSGSGDSYCDLTGLLRNYPASFMDKARRALLNLSLRYPLYGVPFTVDETEDKLLFCETEEAAAGICRILCDLRYLKALNGRNTYMITAGGWKEAETQQRENSAVRQGFIAMSYGPGTEPIREAFRTAIESCGYFPCIIDEMEYNGQVVPEIFYEIGRSRFMVVDVTFPNFGAYYEAGYGQGMGKQVIVCCREDVFGSADRPHFDIAQKSMVVWRTADELVERLARRIEATVK